MKWNINLKNGQDKEIQLVIDYCQNWLLNYDTKKLDEIRINNGRRTKGDTFYGHCSYPNKKLGEKEFKVVCHINENIQFPFRRYQRRSPIYFKKNDVLVEGAQLEYDKMANNKNWELGVRLFARNNDKMTEWVRVYEWITYNSFDECIASIFGHEISHFLSKTKQIKVHNTEIEIDKAEDKFLEEYRTYKHNVLNQ
ncbi:MAG: hypothetical protein WC554_09745 [Clostridia bacterium]